MSSEEQGSCRTHLDAFNAQEPQLDVGCESIAQIHHFRVAHSAPVQYYTAPHVQRNTSQSASPVIQSPSATNAAFRRYPHQIKSCTPHVMHPSNSPTTHSHQLRGPASRLHHGIAPPLPPRPVFRAPVADAPTQRMPQHSRPARSASAAPQSGPNTRTAHRLPHSANYRAQLSTCRHTSSHGVIVTGIVRTTHNTSPHYQQFTNCQHSH